MNLNAFLNPEMPEEKEIIISKRFKDEEGNVVPFKIKPLTQEDNTRLIKRATRRNKNGTQEFDRALFQKLLICEATVVPDFRAEELCSRYQTLLPEDVPQKMLLAGEYIALGKEIEKLSGFTDEAAKEVAEEAKN